MHFTVITALYLSYICLWSARMFSVVCILRYRTQFVVTMDGVDKMDTAAEEVTNEGEGEGGNKAEGQLTPFRSRVLYVL